MSTKRRATSAKAGSDGEAASLPAPPSGAQVGAAPSWSPAGAWLDPVSQMLDDLRPFVLVPGALRLAPPWGVQMPMGHGGFCAILEGRCVLTVSGEEEMSVELQAGDCAVVVRGECYTVRDSRGTKAVPMDELLAERRSRPAALSGNGATVMINGLFFFPSGEPPTVLTSLPACLHVANEKGRPASCLSGILSVLAAELESPSPGAMAVRSRLGGALLVEAVRRYVASAPQESAAALQEPHIARVMQLMRSRPGDPWSVDLLAREASLSRSSFAAQFRETVGVSPMAYLHTIRMERAREMLRHTRRPLRQIAESVGYGSEAAFSNAYRRWAGVSPGADRHG